MRNVSHHFEKVVKWRKKYHKVIEIMESSEIYLFHHTLLFHWTKNWVIEHSHYLASRQLEVSKLASFIRNLKGLLVFLDLNLIILVGSLSFKPQEKLLVSFIRLEGVEDISLLAEEAIYLTGVILITGWLS